MCVNSIDLEFLVYGGRIKIVWFPLTFITTQDTFNSSCSQVQQQPFADVLQNRCSLKKFAIFARKHLCWNLFLINIVTKRIQLRCFPVNIAKFLRTAFSSTPPVAASTGSLKKRCSETFRKLQQNVLLRESFFIKLQTYMLQLCENRGSGTGVLL